VGGLAGLTGLACLAGLVSQMFDKVNKIKFNLYWIDKDLTGALSRSL
jgi:hypothetical protein